MEGLVISEDEGEVVDEVVFVRMKAVEMVEVTVQMGHLLVEFIVVNQGMGSDILPEIFEKLLGH